MEKPLDRCLDEVFNTPGVTGVLCADAQGLCLSAKGTAYPRAAGIITSLMKQAAQLEPTADKLPVLRLESESCNILIQGKSEITLAVYKTPE
ncbi:ragulator complex protein LAMTOR5 homolog [Tachypleus tridentatus]|uniref:ragulator complex protein LAMTOR5 homolog n=1 Tax=Tachypleus tridentatus TaxID=6853 RepID=UPI003FD36E92